jgi:hypothetical protein
MTPMELCRRAGRRTRRAVFAPRFHPRAGFDRGRGGLLTCAGKHDRAGSQALAVLSTMVFAERAGLQYVHTPFRQMDGTPPEEVARWEAFFNLGDGEVRVDDSGMAGRAVVSLPSPAHLPFFFSRHDTLFVTRHCHDYANRHPDEYLRVVSRFREKYATGSRGTMTHHTPSALNVAVHVRRGDVTRDGPYADRYTPDSYLRAVIASVQAAAAHAGTTAALRLYSDGRPEEFAGLSDLGLEDHVEDDPFTTFHNLATADVLVMSKSTFSYVAALLSRGVVIYESFSRTSFNHRPLSSWLMAGEDGTLAQGALVSALQRARR